MPATGVGSSGQITPSPSLRFKPEQDKALVIRGLKPASPPQVHNAGNYIINLDNFCRPQGTNKATASKVSSPFFGASQTLLRQEPGIARNNIQTIDTSYPIIGKITHAEL